MLLLVISVLTINTNTYIFAIYKCMYILEQHKEIYLKLYDELNIYINQFKELGK